MSRSNAESYATTAATFVAGEEGVTGPHILALEHMTTKRYRWVLAKVYNHEVI